MVETDSFEDAFGRKVVVGSSVIFVAYEQLAKGEVVKITYNPDAYWDDERWGIFIRKDEGVSYAYSEKPQPSRLRNRSKIARIS